MPAGRSALHKSAGVTWLSVAEGTSVSFVKGGLAGDSLLCEEQRGSDRAGKGSGSAWLLTEILSMEASRGGKAELITRAQPERS